MYYDNSARYLRKILSKICIGYSGIERKECNTTNIFYKVEDINSYGTYPILNPLDTFFIIKYKRVTYSSKVRFDKVICYSVI
jgi:hypothetical protein